MYRRTRVSDVERGGRSRSHSCHQHITGCWKSILKVFLRCSFGKSVRIRQSICRLIDSPEVEKCI